jgi:hypothetical protein
VWGGSVERNGEPMDKNRIEGVAEQGERAQCREAVVIKARWRKSGGCAVKPGVIRPATKRATRDKTPRAWGRGGCKPPWRERTCSARGNGSEPTKGQRESMVRTVNRPWAMP